MKKLFLVLFLFFSTSLAIFAQNIFTLLATSQEFFDVLDKEKYEEAQGFFDPAGHDKITPESLKALWSQLKTALGEFEGTEMIKSSNEGEITRIILEVKFSNSSQNFLLVYNNQQKITGLFLAPNAESGPAYVLPKYADTTKYAEKEIQVETKDHKLVGLFTYPKNIQNFPIVVLVHGSGPADMDQTVGPNKTFKDISVGLASQGIATIRYVKRTMVYQLEGALTVKEETIDDAVAAIALAKKMQGVNAKKVFLYGHSLGGMLAPRIATSVPDIAGVIIAAGPARTLTDLIIDQNKYFFELSNDTTAASKARFDEMMKSFDPTRLTALNSIKPDSLISGLPAVYWADLNKMNQTAIAKGLVKPKFYIAQGGMDFQVFKTDFDLWNTSLAGRKNVKSKYYPDLDHFFISQTEKGNPQQYQKPGNVSEEYIKDLAVWMLEK